MDPAMRDLATMTSLTLDPATIDFRTITCNTID